MREIKLTVMYAAIGVQESVLSKCRIESNRIEPNCF